MRSRLLTVLAAAGPALLAGCTSGELAMQLLATTELDSLEYRLEPDGRLTVTEGGGKLEGQRDRPVYETRLDEPAMERMKQVIAHSGFLLTESPTRWGLSPAPLIRMDVRLGMWHNVVQTRGRRVESLGKIIAEMNRQLPERYQLIYEPPPDEEETTTFESLLK
jgi:hypothetical protein